MNKVFDQSDLRQFVRSPLFQRNQSSGFDAPHCNTIMATAYGNWQRWGPFHLWARGTYRLSHGYTTDDLAEFNLRKNAAFDTGGGLTPRGLGVASIGDARALTRYRTATWRAQGITRIDGPPDPYIDYPYDYSLVNTYHRYSGVLISVIGTSLCANPYYSSSISDAGVVTESGDVNGWFNCSPEPPSVPNLMGMVADEPGAWGEISIGENTATLTFHAPSSIYFDLASAIDFVFTITLSDAWTLEDSLSDTEDLLDVFELDSLSKNYGTIANQDDGFLHWNISYEIVWNHAVGVPLARLISNQGAVTFVRARRFPPFFGLGIQTKNRSGTLRLNTALYSEEQTLPEPATTQDPDNGHNGVFPGQTDCVNPYTNGVREVSLGPRDLIFAFGQATLQRTCAGDGLCTP